MEKFPTVLTNIDGNGLEMSCNPPVDPLSPDETKSKTRRDAEKARPFHLSKTFSVSILTAKTQQLIA